MWGQDSYKQLHVEGKEPKLIGAAFKMIEFYIYIQNTFRAV